MGAAARLHGGGGAPLAPAVVWLLLSLLAAGVRGGHNPDDLIGTSTTPTPHRLLCPAARAPRVVPWDWGIQYAYDLPRDKERGNFVREVKDAAYSYVDPEPIPSPALLAVSESAAALIGLHTSHTESEEFLSVVSGGSVPLGALPIAHAYGGHQFGSWSGQLGDGRAISLGALRAAKGVGVYDLQLKGAGKTPYSRSGDGRAVLRSSVREFLASEAMDALGIPTTRALSLAVAGGPPSVLRDPFYNGGFINETAAVVARLSPSWVRFGHFELLAERRDLVVMRQLLEHVSNRFYLISIYDSRVLAGGILGEVAWRTGRLVAKWAAVGFANGVLNTDNMSILGLSIDYGPFGWMDAYDPTSTPNTSDDDVPPRYSFKEQKNIAKWCAQDRPRTRAPLWCRLLFRFSTDFDDGEGNLEKLADALFPMLDGDKGEGRRRALSNYTRSYEDEWIKLHRAKLGLIWSDASGDRALAVNLLALMKQAGVDFTNTWRGLSSLAAAAPYSSPGSAALDASFAGEGVESKWEIWKSQYRARLAEDDAAAERMGLSPGMAPRTRASKMNSTNPKYVLRNWVAQQAIAAAEGGDGGALVRELLRVLRSPFAEHPEHEGYSQPPPTEELRNLKVSCSS